MHFYCQLDYEHVPYPSPMGVADGNIANNGCGVCSASMLIESLLGIPFPVEACAEFAKRIGAREGYGTNFYILAGALAAKFDLTMRPTEDVEVAAQGLRSGAKVIANTQGDREGYIGVFSDSGHYLMLDAIRGNEVCVFDPMYRPGRYDIPGRIGKVHMDEQNPNAAWADLSVLREDCRDRPFFLFYAPGSQVR